MSRPRILVTNDDGIDSVGMQVLARALTELGDVTVVAPDKEYSGASASIGALYLMTPEVHETSIDGIDTAWSVSGPPGLCIMFTRLGVFGPQPDLVVSGINPGANVGRAVYHSGTIGAGFTARLGNIPSIAISQSVTNFGVEGQGWEETLEQQLWDSAASVAVTAAAAVLTEPPDDAGVLNLNVPNLPLEEIKGWAWTQIAQTPPRSMAEAHMEPKPGHKGTYRVKLTWGEQSPQPPNTDTATVINNTVSATWLSRITALNMDSPKLASALDGLLGDA